VKVKAVKEVKVKVKEEGKNHFMKEKENGGEET